jgi:hypothetical protein
LIIRWVMSELKAKVFRDFFGGSWIAKITKNGEFQREVVFNWPKTQGKFASLGTEPGGIVPPGEGVIDDTRQVAISGWRCDIRRWVHLWHNEFGGYGEIEWTSQTVIDETTTLYGVCHECKQESDDPTEHIVMCEIFDQNNFKYTIQSFRKGLTEIVASRIRTSTELNTLLEKQAETAINFDEFLG